MTFTPQGAKIPQEEEPDLLSTLARIERKASPAKWVITLAAAIFCGGFATAARMTEVVNTVTRLDTEAKLAEVQERGQDSAINTNASSIGVALQNLRSLEKMQDDLTRRLEEIEKKR